MLKAPLSSKPQTIIADCSWHNSSIKKMLEFVSPVLPRPCPYHITLVNEEYRCVNCDVCMRVCCQVRGSTGKVRDKQLESGAGYLSDGHTSSRSSDNESGSVCSEMVGRALNTSGVLDFLLCLKATVCYFSSPFFNSYASIVEL